MTMGVGLPRGWGQGAVGPRLTAMKRWASAALVVLALAGCAQPRSVDPEAAGQTSAVVDASTLAGSTWVLQSTSHGGSIPSPRSGRPQSIAFTATGIDAYDGCNDVTSDVTYLGDQIKLGTVWNTAMACDNNVVENAVATVFANEGTVRAGVVGTTLTVSGHGDTLTYVPAPTPTATPNLRQQLIGPLWQLVSWSKDSPTYRVPKGSRASVLFSASTVVADDGCNDQTASVAYGTGKVSLTFVVQMTTEVACSGPGVDPRIASAYAALLHGPAAANVGGNTLTLVGRATLTFSKVADRPVAPSGSPAPSVAPLATVDPSALRSAVVDKVWRLVSVTRGTTTTAVPSGQGATLRLTATSYEAKDGCATHIGLIRYTLTGVNTSDQGVKGSECAASAMVAAAYEAIFSGTPRFQFQGDGGVTLGSGSTVLAFLPDSAVRTPTTG
ncbi:hypothetical protein acdb102_09950 [Acidothermaceae bacterium B102]|nr:hypothetical protein acdb102_09950 [Acidothermaceae bacterium B102]